MKKLLLYCWICCLPCLVWAQSADIHPRILNREWEAAWIACPGVPLKSFGVYHFRKSFRLEAQPSKFVIHVSADNRYRLFVNGVPVAHGPARGDLAYWYFETIDIAPYLQAGNNTLAAVVWNFAEHMAWAQISHQTGFILQGNTESEAVVNTNSTWKTLPNYAISPIPVRMEEMRTFIVVGPGEAVDGNRYPWGWEEKTYDDSQWQQAISLYKGMPRGRGTGAVYYLVPRTIPIWQETAERFRQVRRLAGIAQVPENWLKGKQPLPIPAHTRATVLLDNQQLTTAYPEIMTQGGKGAVIELTYAEALVDEKLQKHHRDRTEGLQIFGYKDRFLPDGGANRLFRPLWFRTFRYVQVDIQTAAEPLVISDISHQFTAYPMEENARFSSDDAELEKIWKTGWRTARLCANETFFDCPYYEQLQYVGDTRIQALIALYVSGDDRLVRKAIQDINRSRVPEGLTQARYPSAVQQFIPPFSLYWVSMVHDYWMHRQDDDFVRQMLPGIQQVLQWFADNIDRSKDMLGGMPWWNFTDWTEQWQYLNETSIGGVPDGAEKGYSSILTFHYAYTLRQAAELFDYYEQKEQAALYLQQAEKLARAAYNACYDVKRGLVADTPQKTSFSQHAQIMAVLSGGAPLLQQASLIERALADPTVTQASLYYRFYLTRAMVRAGLADFYYASLQPWRDMLALGLTTFAEKSEPTRSDCHAWSASPNYDFLATICGIMPDAPGFAKVRIAPALGMLKSVAAAMPHPEGMIRVSFERLPRNAIKAVIELPANTEGALVWNGKSYPLTSGNNIIVAR
ncbi:MAG: alpha-L-rhamnosidase C-terminal domain-containing protein [Cytophagales bacterium]|nr:glycoside hydrolase family 78 protein [Bernardetiaceae bacterium]MDW8204311.1 alpha-L-rhamnosidase C-terminal domain-containing protein [Cytophagales bacterium]